MGKIITRAWASKLIREGRAAIVGICTPDQSTGIEYDIIDRYDLQRTDHVLR